MANNQINKLLEFANMQMAAEAFLVEGNELAVPEDRYLGRLWIHRNWSPRECAMP